MEKIIIREVGLQANFKICLRNLNLRRRSWFRGKAWALEVGQQTLEGGKRQLKSNSVSASLCQGHRGFGSASEYMEPTDPQVLTQKSYIILRSYIISRRTKGPMKSSP